LCRPVGAVQQAILNYQRDGEADCRLIKRVLTIRPSRKSNAMDSWFVGVQQRPRRRLRLFCFPYAGGGSLIFRQWADRLPADIEVVAVELPGRGGRLRERAFCRLSDLVGALMGPIAPLLDVPYALFGHSMGAMIAFELTRALRRCNRPQPEGLFVSARAAPHIIDCEPVTYTLPDAELIGELEKLNGTPPEVLGHLELMQMMLPLIRADFELVQTYQYSAEQRLQCPITAFGGIRDIEVPQCSLLPWGEHTSSEFKLRLLDGDHFFLKSSQNELLSMLSCDLNALA
jgi:medium-chain acyl-[acyl-carrier-protein] hydrolase